MMGEQNTICKTIKECETGKYADLKLFILKQYPRTIVKICTGCDSKKCTCGKKLYKDKVMYFFDAIDGHGNHINVRSAPWSNTDLGNVKEEHFYRIKGKIGRPFNQKFDLIIDKIEEIFDY